MLNILHLVGSADSDFYVEVSSLYARDCIAAVADPELYKFTIAYVTPDGCWRFPTSLAAEDIGAAEVFSETEAIAILKYQPIDLMLPQMFCISGMTRYRKIFDEMGIPYIGNRAEVMSLTAHKAAAKEVVRKAGVKVPYGEVLRYGDKPLLKPPVVVKPVNTDNSIGMSLVRDETDFAQALKSAFDCSDEILVEEFIEAGREVRCGVIVIDGQLIALPLEEYRIDRQHPVRDFSAKLKRGDEGQLKFSAKDNQFSWIVDTDDPITARVQEIAKNCHNALGCRHYSLFDFRIDPQGQPWFLEAGLYCSFSPKSVIPSMARVAGISLQQLFATMVSLVMAK